MSQGETIVSHYWYKELRWRVRPMIEETTLSARLPSLPLREINGSIYNTYIIHRNLRFGRLFVQFCDPDYDHLTKWNTLSRFSHIACDRSLRTIRSFDH